jgi:hypothetical protein
MPHQSPRLSSRTRLLVWAVSVGLLFTVALGVGFQSSERLDPKAANGAAAVEMVFAPQAALVGSLAGVPLGAMIGWLLGGPGLRRAAGFALAAVAGAFAGMLTAALVGSETRVSAFANGLQVEHGAPPAVLVVGAVLGVALGALAAYRASRLSAPASVQLSATGWAGDSPNI